MDEKKAFLMAPSTWQEAWRQITVRQYETARAVADLTLAFRQRDINLDRQHEEIKGMVMALQIFGGRSKSSAPKGDDDEISQKFPLVSGASIELSQKRQHQIIRIVLVAAMFVLSHVAAYFIMWAQRSSTPPQPVVAPAAPSGTLVPPLTSPHSP